MFQNVGKSAFKKDLGNTLKLLEFLGNPHLHKKFIHVGGTNGKGSVSSMLASILTQAGYKTGLYTSPHLISFTERIRINGIEIDESFVISFVERTAQVIEEIQPSFFELTVAMAFDYFHQKDVDIAVIEVGLGGRLDSTNVITPLLSVITSIGYDHMDLLGNTLSDIAFEKSGIIKQNIPVVLSKYVPEEAIHVIKTEAERKHSQIHMSHNANSSIQRKLSLRGHYQQQNLGTVLQCIEVLQQNGISISSSDVETALGQITKLSGLRGRWETIPYKIPVICDTGHNSEAIPLLMKQLYEEYPNDEKHIIWGMVSDKDRNKILELLPTDAHYYVVKPGVIRGLDANILAEDMVSKGLRAFPFPNFSEALSAIEYYVDSTNSVIFIGGSTFLVADALVYFNQ